MVRRLLRSVGDKKTRRLGQRKSCLPNPTETSGVFLPAGEAQVQIHHIDGFRRNNTADHLAGICLYCHKTMLLPPSTCIHSSPNLIPDLIRISNSSFALHIRIRAEACLPMGWGKLELPAEAGFLLEPSLPSHHSGKSWFKKMCLGRDRIYHHRASQRGEFTIHTRISGI